jgi:putative NADH-flavin reductase
MNPTNTAQSGLPESNRNIVVIGSTGRTGRFVLEEGLCRGHSMTAFTRRPETLAGVQGLRSVVTGDGRRLEDLRRALRGQDAVISIVSSEGRGPTTVMSDVTRAELDAMREAGVRRLVSVSVSAIEGRRPWILINLVRWLLRKPYADFGRMERLIRSSPVDWTIVRPPYLSNGPKTGLVRMQVGGKDLRHGPYHISRADLAATLVDLAEDSQHVGEVLLVSERRQSAEASRGRQ